MVRKYRFLVVMAVSAIMLAAPLAHAQFFTPGPNNHDQLNPDRCQGAVRLVSDVGFEGRRSTPANFSAVPGGGEGGRFDPTPVLTTKVDLTDGCLNAHFSAVVGSSATYGAAFSPTTLFQVTASLWDPATMTWGPPQHLYGHWETPYGIYAPAVAIGAERDVDTLSANFFHRVGPGPDDFPPGIYRVDVWWVGAPPAGGATGAAFVLKLYQP